MDPQPTSLAFLAALVAGVVTVIGAIVTGVVTIITAYKVAKIEGHVNSEKTAAEGRQAALVHENEILRKIMERDATTAQLLAQASVTMTALTRHPGPAAPLTPPAGEQDPTPVEVVNLPLEIVSAPKPKGK